MITRATLSTIEQGLPKYRSMLAGNAAFLPVAFESIATTTLGTNAVTITFNSIPQTYQHLQLRIMARNADVSNSASPLNIFFNNSTSSWDRHALFGDGSTASANGSANQGTGYIGWFPNNGTGAPSTFGVSIIDIHDYASTTKNKTVRMMSGTNTNGVFNNSRMYLASGLWRSTSAVTRIDINDDNAYNILAGSTFALYGIKGS